MEYNEYSFEFIKELINKGKEFKAKGEDETAIICQCIANGFTYSMIKFIIIGFNAPENYEPKVGMFLRIGEPRIDEDGIYKSSWDDEYDFEKDGVAVVTTAWLNNSKSAWFNTTDEAIEDSGVYKFIGIALPTICSNGEVLIIPLDWAVRTEISTHDDLEKEVKKLEENNNQQHIAHEDTDDD